MNKDQKQPILVTGAGSGIGYYLTKALAEAGHVVFATARKESDLAALASMKNVVALLMDVRSPEQVEAAYQQVRQAGLGLYAVINNAGVGDLGLLATWTDEELFDIFNTNVFGVHRVTNTFLPLLVESHGRVINIGSQGGMLSKKYFGPYTMTKHALESYSATLRDELQPYGVRVAIIQPGGITTTIGEKSAPRTIARFQRARPPFDEEARLVLESFSQPAETDPAREAPESDTNRKPSSPAIVWAAVRDALYSDEPRLRYLVGTRWEGDRVLNALIEQLLEENDSPQHNYSRDELVALLDEHLRQRDARPLW
jgi:NAD(P)-dependent dehydrogenase (short-subunit alcohol dehydrogenase family)